MECAFTSETNLQFSGGEMVQVISRLGLFVAIYASVAANSLAQPARIDTTATPLARQAGVPVPAPMVAGDEGSQVVVASATEPVSRTLQNVLQQAKSDLDSGKLPKIDAARANLGMAIANFRAYVGLATGTGRAWNKFLRLDELAEEIEKERPSGNRLADIEMNMRQNYLGLEYPEFLRLRSALTDMVRASKYGSAPDRTVEFLEALIDSVTKELSDPVEDSGLRRSSRVGLVANYLHETSQAPWAVSAIREQFNIPNVQLYAQEQLVNRFVARAVAEPSPVNECILGTRILGNACLSGFVNADLLPMNNGIALMLTMNATLSSRNKGYNRGVVFNTTGNSPVLASKQIVITPNGVSTSPASVSTNLQSNINSIEHKLRIVRRIARKKAAEQKPQADRIAEGRMQTKIQTQFDQQVDTQVAQAGGGLSFLNQPPRPEMVRIGVPKPSLAVYSTDSTVNGNMVQAASYQLSAPNSCPFGSPFDALVVLEAHQSAINNALDIALGGRTIRSEELDDYAKQITGSVSPEIKEESEGEPWTITLASFHPVELEFDNNVVKLQLRISDMTRGEQRLSDDAIISATYRPTYFNGVLTLKREGEVTIEFTRQARGLRVVTLRSFLKGKFDKALQEEIRTKQLDLASVAPQAVGFDISSIKIDGGWVQVGVK